MGGKKVATEQAFESNGVKPFASFLRNNSDKEVASLVIARISR